MLLMPGTTPQYHGSDPHCLRQVVQAEWILREVGDVHDILACTNNVFEHYVSYGIGHRTNDHVRVFNGARDSFSRGKVLNPYLDWKFMGQALQSLPVDVHRDDLIAGILA